MNKINGALIATLLATSLLGGCANLNETQQNTLGGAGIGAVAGGIIGSMSGHALGGAAAGAAVGAIGGSLMTPSK